MKRIITGAAVAALAALGALVLPATAAQATQPSPPLISEQCEAVPAVTETQHRYQREVTEYKTQYHFRKFTRERTQVVVSPEIWQNFSPNRDQGRFEGPPTWPTDPRGTWHHQDKSIPGGHQGPDGVYQKGHGNSSWFYRQAAVLDWSAWGGWTAWEPETHTSWEDSDAALGQPAYHASGTTNGLKWERQWQAQFDGQTRQVENGTSTETSDWMTSVPEGDGWTMIDTREFEVSAAQPERWQTSDPEGPCFNRPSAPEPLTGEETRTADPVCVIPLNGMAEVDTEGRTWEQGHAWNEQEQRYDLTERVYGDWQVQSTQVIEIEECAAEIPPAPEVPEEPKKLTPTAPLLAETGAPGSAPVSGYLAGGLMLFGAALAAVRLIRRARA